MGISVEHFTKNTHKVDESNKEGRFLKAEQKSKCEKQRFPLSKFVSWIASKRKKPLISRKSLRKLFQDEIDLIRWMNYPTLCIWNLVLLIWISFVKKILVLNCIESITYPSSCFWIRKTITTKALTVYTLLWGFDFCWRGGHSARPLSSVIQTFCKCA